MRNLVLTACLALPLAAQTYTPESFAAELGKLETALNQDAAPAQLPEQWSVETPTRTFSISPAKLRERLAKSDREVALGHIAQMRRQAESYSLPPAEYPDPRGAVQKILARSEFAESAPPSALEQMSARIQAWIQDLISRISRYAAAGSEFLFWLIVTVAMGGLGIWLFRALREAERIMPLPRTRGPQAELQSWQAWLADARAAAAAGDHRQAIRCAYWAGIARLQQDRAMHIDFTDTPRERLRLLAKPGRRGGDLAPDKLQPISEITRQFERTWYAALPATSDDAARSLASLEALGCRAD